MPNWCENEINIKGKKKQIKELLSLLNITEDVNNKNLDKIDFFEVLLPYPNGVWNYDWCVKNWGIKWDININYIESSNIDNLYISCDTPWSPPLEGLINISKLFNLNIHCNYNEFGMGFAGEFNVINGIVTVDENWDIYGYHCKECGDTIESRIPINVCPYCEVAFPE